MKNNQQIRILGKGLTAQALHFKFPNSIMYDDNDFEELFDVDSDVLTIASPGIPPDNKMIINSKNLISDYDLFYDDMPFTIWISGTNGKTTTTQMTQYLLEQYGSICGGNIGIPLSSMDINAKIWILETSSFTMHYTKIAKPNLYLLLPITEDHITWHGNFEEYKNAKLKPLNLMNENDIAIIPLEFKDYQTKAKVITYKNSDDLCEYFGINKRKVKFNEPFLLDSLLALVAKKILFDIVDYDLINQFIIDKHKVEEFFDSKNRLWIDDSKATNIDATIKGLVPYKDRDIHLIIGGDDKGANLEPLFKELSKIERIKVYAIGTNTQKVYEYCLNYRIDVIRCNFLDKAVLEMSKEENEDFVGMLSPAAASLDQFKSYAHRGDEFKKFVNNLS